MLRRTGLCVQAERAARHNDTMRNLHLGPLFAAVWPCCSRQPTNMHFRGFKLCVNSASCRLHPPDESRIGIQLSSTRVRRALRFTKNGHIYAVNEGPNIFSHYLADKLYWHVVLHRHDLGVVDARSRRKRTRPWITHHSNRWEAQSWFVSHERKRRSSFVYGAVDFWTYAWLTTAMASVRENGAATTSVSGLLHYSQEGRRILTRNCNAPHYFEQQQTS